MRPSKSWLMNSINWPAPSVWVFIAQLVEHCGANAEATLCTAIYLGSFVQRNASDPESDDPFSDR